MSGVAVLASGQGTILDALAEEGVPIAVVLVDRPCRATEVAARHQIPVEAVLRDSYGDDFDRRAYTEKVLTALAPYDIELVALAGFNTIFSSDFIDRWPERILNTHPTLLPAFGGLHGSKVIQAALDAGVEETGCTVHLVTAEVDAGPILAQEAVPVLPDDTVETLHERIKVAERRLYPKTIKELLS